MLLYVTVKHIVYSNSHQLFIWLLAQIINLDVDRNKQDF